MKNIDEVTNLLGYKIVSSRKERLLKKIFSHVESGIGLQIVCTPNPEQLVYAKSHSWFGKTLGKSDILLPDGMGIVIGSQILSVFGKSEPIIERIAGVDVASELLKQFHDKKFLIIGGREYAGSEFQNWKVIAAGDRPKRVKSSVRFLYWHEGFLNVTLPTGLENKELIEHIRNLRPEILFVALGAPYQEKWIFDNKKELSDNGVRLAMAVGGSFDMLLGKVKRAPKWMQRIGLEWLFRLYKEPWRWRRQVNLLVFLKMVIQEALASK